MWVSEADSIGVAQGRRRSERRRADSLTEHWMALVLDELDQGVLLLSGAGRVIHTNLAARRSLAQGHPLCLEAGQLRARLVPDQAAWTEALESAQRLGRRCLLRLGTDPSEWGRASVAVVPLNREVEQPAVLVLLERRQLCADLAAQWFALRHQLTPAETEVLKGLSAGARPGDVAAQQGVAISTVRSQIQSIRAKSGADSIGELLRRLALLPPLVSTLRGRPESGAQLS